MDLHNIYSLIVERFAEEQHNFFKRAYLRRETRLLRHVERQAASEVDLLFAVSHAEVQAYRSLGAKAVELVPNGVDCSLFDALPAGRAEAPPNLLFLGTMSWGPNAHAASFLAREVLPRVRETVPEAKLWIVGRNPPADVAALDGHGGVVVTGGVPDVVPYFRDARFLVVPLESGGGTRLKILEAFAAGLPVVSTPVGVEGIDAVPGVHLSVVDRTDFATTMVRLMKDPADAHAQARAARHFVQDRYDWAGIGVTAVNALHQHLQSV
jgi:glycosyltransferase involved in cell wall biosynthesis